ncbi:hypothetical protein TNCV_658081 [Trichonephila clavipes]|uniref:Uncharacterized protein n=1 Tax=Trichonephila clavipes TaxID=2585209 RepID=A0A8X6STD2_TRICX|nr:hypothetical protein TNCV_658081 [Trichonephila clavipes]
MDTCSNPSEGFTDSSTERIVFPKNVYMRSRDSAPRLTSVGTPYDDPSRTPIARSAPMIFTSTTPGGFHDEY